MIELVTDNEMAIVECDNCHQKDEFELIDVLDTELDIFEKNKLIGGTFFEHKCSNCGCVINYYHPMVYHDRPHNVMIYYVPKEEYVDPFCAGLALTNLALTRHAVEFEENIPEHADWIQRVVCCPNRLREKVEIFEANLDDRVIELIKIVVLSFTLEQHPEFDYDTSWFCVENGKWFIELNGHENELSDSEGCYRVEITRNIYDEVEKHSCDILEDWQRIFVVDEDWALEAMGYNEENKG